MISIGMITLRDIPIDKIKMLVEQSESTVDFLRKCGFNTRGGRFRTFHKIVKEYGIDISHFAERTNIKRRTTNTLTEKEVKEKLLIKLPVFKKVKHYIIKYNLIPYVCEKCNMADIWQNEKLILQLDHRDGDNTNNVLENLRFLCPNCHSQTTTYGGRNNCSLRYDTGLLSDTMQYIDRQLVMCPYCSKEFSGFGESCHSCASKRMASLNWPPNEELKKMVWEKPLLQLGTELNMSANTIKNHCITHNITLPPFGYWRRISTGHSHEEALYPIKKKAVKPFVPPTDDIKKILLESHLPLRRLAEQYKVSRKYITNLRSKHNSTS
jgi:hypothetical protein